MLTTAIGTLAHEYQHLINAGRRMYVNTDATDFEEVWLNEGLSHIAEELLFFRVSGTQPRQNLDAPTIQRLPALVDAFNNYESANAGRLELFLEAVASNSPFADDDSLETRGATTAFLRYVADHYSGAENAMWNQLVNSTTTGLSNLTRVLGSDVMGTFRDFSTSLFTDDLAATEARYQEPSWNWRSLYAALLRGSAFPLATVSLTPGNATTLSVVAGSAAYLRFGVAAGGSGAVQMMAPAAATTWTVVRVK